MLFFFLFHTSFRVWSIVKLKFYYTMQIETRKKMFYLQLCSAGISYEFLNKCESKQNKVIFYLCIGNRSMNIVQLHGIITMKYLLLLFNLSWFLALFASSFTPFFVGASFRRFFFMRASRARIITRWFGAPARFLECKLWETNYAAAAWLGASQPQTCTLHTGFRIPRGMFRSWARSRFFPLSIFCD